VFRLKWKPVRRVGPYAFNLSPPLANEILDATGVPLTTVIKTLEKVRNYLEKLLI